MGGPSKITQVNYLEIIKTHLPHRWESLDYIQKTLRSRSYKVYLVGGAVRNLVLGAAITDFDLCTDADPHAVLKIFPRSIPTGLKHGTVTVLHKKEHFEITTFRIDGAYTDSRRPDSVAFTSDLLEDLRRRDFTINAMALDLESGKLHDPHGGRRDLAGKLVRTVGVAEERFGEDALRIVRGIRFACQLEFTLDPESLAAMGRCAGGLKNVSAERFRDELIKILAAPKVEEGLQLLRKLGIFSFYLPFLQKLGNPAFDTLKCLCHLLRNHDRNLSLSALFKVAQAGGEGPAENCPSGSTPTLTSTPTKGKKSGSGLEADMKALKLSNEETKFILSALELSERPYGDDWTDADLRRFLSRCRPKDAQDFLTFTVLYHLSLRDPTVRAYPFALIERMKSRLADCLGTDPPLTLARLALKGADLMALGLKPGPRLGDILDLLLQEVIDDPSRNSPEYLAQQAKSLYEERR